MAKHQARPTIDAPNEIELVDQLDQTAGLLASAAQAFCDLSSLFEEIKAAAPEGSLQNRLAQAGINMSESLNCDFDRYSADFGADVECYSTALGIRGVQHLCQAPLATA